VVQRLPVDGISGDGTRRRIWISCGGGATTTAATSLGDCQRARQHKDEQRREQNFGLHIFYLGCVITSMRYGLPRFTDSTPRFKAAANNFGSEIGPSLAMPYPAAILA